MFETLDSDADVKYSWDDSRTDIYGDSEWIFKKAKKKYDTLFRSLPTVLGKLKWTGMFNIYSCVFITCLPFPLPCDVTQRLMSFL